MRQRHAMFRRLLALTLLVSLQALGRSMTAPVADGLDAQKAGIAAAYANVPLAFEPNLGQAPGEVNYAVRHGSAATYFTNAGTTTVVGDSAITMSLTGAAEQDFSGADELPSKTNYFLGDDQSKWQSDVPNYGKLFAKNVYPGIDLAYYGTNSQLEHDFIVAPGVDYRQIAFGFTGQDELSLDDNGNLVLKAGEDTLTLNAPVTYQIDTNSKHTIPSNFELNDGTVTIAVADTYDPAKPLIIDPVLSLVYSTYLGGSGNDQGLSITVDAAGNAYVTGQTDSTNFPTSSPFQGSNGGSVDAFVTKLDSSGSALVYSTYLGGSGSDQANSIVVDSSGNAYVVGATASTNFPTSSPFQAAHAAGGGNDAFVTKLNPSGAALVYSTYLGGTGANDVGRGIAVDDSGNVYVTGNTSSNDFPLESPFQASFAFSTSAFVTKFNPAGSALVYSTYLGGGTGGAIGRGIAIDGSGNVYVTGGTADTDFPTESPFQGSNAGDLDVFVTKLDSSGSALVYSTYLGGTWTDTGNAIAVDTGGNAYVTGATAWTDFPTASPFQGSSGGSVDAFVTKLDSSGSALVYSTYLGGTGAESANGIGVDGVGNAYVTGYTNSTSFPTASPFQASFGGSFDAFVTKFNATGSALVYSTYLGGNGSDLGQDVAVDTSGDAYVTSYGGSTNFPTTSPFQAGNAGGNDVFITQLTEHTVDLEARVNPTLTFAVGSTSCVLGTLSTTQTQQCTYALSAATNGESGYGISYLPAATLTSGGNTITALGSSTASTLNTEQFGLNLAANTAAGSHTATDFGAAPSGGSGVVAANYSTANSFKFATAGEQVASSAGPSLATTYTVSTIANIGNTTEAGAYSTTVTFTIVAGY